MKWSSSTINTQGDWRLALNSSSSQPVPRIGVVEVITVLPSRIMHLLKALDPRPKDIAPVIAMPIYSLEPAPGILPFLFIFVLLIGLFSFLVVRAVPLAFHILFFIIRLARDPIGCLQRQQERFRSHTLRLYDLYRSHILGFLNMTRLYRSLQEQLEEKTMSIRHQGSAIDLLTYDIQGVSAQNELLRLTAERLRCDKLRLRDQLRAEREQHAGDLLSFQEDMKMLSKYAEGLQVEKQNIQARFEVTLQGLQDQNATLQQQLQTKQVAPCNHLKEIAQLVQRLASTEAALRDVTAENSALRKQLSVSEDDATRHQASQARKYTAQQASVVEALEKFKQQLVDQQEEHIKQQNVLAERIVTAKADKTRIKAKLKHARADAESKSTDLARLQSELETKERLLSEQNAHFQMDLGELDQARSESTELRQQLEDMFNSYREQAARLDQSEAGLKDLSLAHAEATRRLDAAMAERRVSSHLEQMLAEDLRRRNDEYETLEISFDVLEKAYSFLAGETVRLEHALKDAISGRWTHVPEEISELAQCPSDLEYEEEADADVVEVESEDGEEDEEQAVPPEATIDAQEHVRENMPAVAKEGLQAVKETSEILSDHDEAVEHNFHWDTEPEDFVPGSILTSTPQRHRFVQSPVSIRSGSSSSSFSRVEVRTASSASLSSDRSWPATPGLTLDTTSSRSTLSSPDLVTPPPMFVSELKRRQLVCGTPSPTPRHSVLSDSDPNDLFSSWSPISVHEAANQ